jgi:hypothetical protein
VTAMPKLAKISLIAIGAFFGLLFVIWKLLEVIAIIDILANPVPTD